MEGKSEKKLSRFYARIVSSCALEETGLKYGPPPPFLLSDRVQYLTEKALLPFLNFSCARKYENEIVIL